MYYLITIYFIIGFLFVKPKSWKDFNRDGVDYSEGFFMFVMSWPTWILMWTTWPLQAIFWFLRK